MTVVCQILNNVTTVLLLDVRYHLETIQEIHVDNNLTWIQQLIQVCLIARKDNVAIRET